MTYNVLNLFGEYITPKAREILTKIGTVEDREMTHSELAKSIHTYDVIFMGLYPELSADVLRRAAKLKVIATAITNPNHIDPVVTEERGIKVLSLKDELKFLDTITGTSEMAVGLLLDLMRFTPWAFQDVAQYHWNREKFRGHNLYGKTLGIFGFGRLGKWMARYGRAFNMNSIVCSPHTVEEECKEFSCRAVGFDTLLKESDVISIHANSTPETRGVFNRSAFQKMKPSVYIVNTAAGEIVNENDLIEALERGLVAGYGTDVLTGELHFGESFSNYPLVEYAKTHQNVVIVPHLGGMTHESREATDIFMAKKLVEYVKQSS